jgi:hypothetical protein
MKPSNVWRAVSVMRLQRRITWLVMPLWSQAC